jgi:thiol-disulfide isomerase/thioredoxin
MENMQKTFLLVVALALIVGSIFYLESLKPKLAPVAGNELPSEQQKEDGAFSIYPKAPELAGITGYINAPSNLTIASLRGKVVLVDFWTYTCINCIRTLPYINSWQEKYANDGLVIIGVHTPEFDFEKDYPNVLAAVKNYGIAHPVVLDNDYATWRAYKNSYWPRKYLIDANGKIRYDHIGEGGYDETEQKIVELLSEAKNKKVQVEEGGVNASDTDFSKIRSPEVYLGAAFRRAPLGNAAPLFPGEEFSAQIPKGELSPNLAYLEGKWTNGNDGVKLNSDSGAVELVFSAKNVNIVAGSANGTNLTIYIDGKRVERQDYCPDAPKGVCGVGGQRLYSVVALPDYGTHRLRMEAVGAGFELYTFTFG